MEINYGGSGLKWKVKVITWIDILPAETVKTYLLSNMTLNRKLLFAQYLAGILKNVTNFFVLNAEISVSKCSKIFYRSIELLMNYSYITFVKKNRQNKIKICISFFPSTTALVDLHLSLFDFTAIPLLNKYSLRT